MPSLQELYTVTHQITSYVCIRLTLTACISSFDPHIHFYDMHYNYVSWFLNESTFPSSIVSLLSCPSHLPLPLPSPSRSSPKKQVDPPLVQLPPPTKTSALKQAYQVHTYTAVGIMQYACVVGNLIGLHTVENTFLQMAKDLMCC